MVTVYESEICFMGVADITNWYRNVLHIHTKGTDPVYTLYNYILGT